MKREVKEFLFKILFMACAVSGIIAVAVIVIFLFAQGIPGITEIGVFKFIFGTGWFPGDNEFGILPMLVNSIYVTVLSVSLGVIIGVLSAVFLFAYCGKRLSVFLKQMVNLLAGIPSVIYGFFGMTVLVPIISDLTGSIGYGLFVSSVILGIMILPTIILISFNSLKSVPRAYYEGALALGATHSQAVFKTVLPAASNGIFAGVLLGINRAVGETMAVVMVSGNKARFAESLFTSIRTLTGNIVLEMGYASGLHLKALIATGLVLFFLVLIIITCFNLYINKKKNKLKEGKKKVLKPAAPSGANENPGKSRLPFEILKYASYSCMGIAMAALGFIIAFITVKGIPYINPDFLFGGYIIGGRVSVFPAFVTTIMLIALTLIIAVPIGIFASIYLAEYTKKGSRAVMFIRSAIETLAGIPSIIYGLFGMLFFVIKLNMGYCIYAGAFTMALMVLPTVIRSTEESLLAVPDSFREGSLSLGAGKSRTIFKIVLPSAISGIITSIILSMGRIIGESAPLLYTVGTSPIMPAGYSSSGITLTVYMYQLAREGLYMNEAYAAGAVLLFVITGLNLLVALIERIFKKKNGFKG